jgi:CRISPR-associated exonuclease Cas4
MPLLITLLVLLGVGLLWLSRRRRERTGLPAGRVIYFDARNLDRPERPLYDARLDLVGRPDYLVRGKQAIVPVEVKSGKSPLEPWSSHVLQLAAYCHLVETSYRQRPGHGILKYADRAYSIDYTEGLENELLDTLAEMRRAGGQAPDRSHESPARCRGCGYREICDQRLT